MDEQAQDHPSSDPHNVDWLKHNNTLGNPTSWSPTNPQSIPPNQPDPPASPEEPTHPRPPIADQQTRPPQPSASNAAHDAITDSTPALSNTTAQSYPPTRPTSTRPARSRNIMWVAIAALCLVALLFFCNLLPLNSLLHIGFFPLWPFSHTSSNYGYTNNNNNPQTAVKSLQLAPNSLLIIDGHNSNITIFSSNTTTTTITTHVHNTNLGPDNATTMHYDQSTNAQGINQLHLFSDPADKDLDYSISTPASTSVQINTDSGSVSVNGIGATTIHTTNGGLDLANLQGPLDATTDSGNINAHDIKGTTTLQTTNGTIHLTSITGQVNATTVSGDVLGTGLALSNRSSLRTTNGSVRVTTSLDPHGAYTFATDSGDINLTIPATTSFTLNAHTNSGNIHNGFNTTSTGNPPHASITLSVGNGSINLDQSS